jgi:hypothetical protein
VKNIRIVKKSKLKIDYKVVCVRQQIMKTELEIEEYRKQIEERLVKSESMDAMKYYQGVLRCLEWMITDKDV